VGGKGKVNEPPEQGKRLVIPGPPGAHGKSSVVRGRRIWGQNGKEGGEGGGVWRGKKGVRDQAEQITFVYNLGKKKRKRKKGGGGKRFLKVGHVAAGVRGRRTAL